MAICVGSTAMMAAYLSRRGRPVTSSVRDISLRSNVPSGPASRRQSAVWPCKQTSDIVPSGPVSRRQTERRLALQADVRQSAVWPCKQTSDRAPSGPVSRRQPECRLAL